MEILVGLIGIIIGIWFGFLLGVGMDDPHRGHVQKYQECLDLGAPKENCFDKYLIGKKP